MLLSLLEETRKGCPAFVGIHAYPGTLGFLDMHDITMTVMKGLCADAPSYVPIPLTLTSTSCQLVATP